MYEKYFINSRGDDTWIVNGKKKANIKEAKYYIAEQLLTRDPVSEELNEVAKEALNETLQEISQIGEKTATKLVRKAKFDDTPHIDSFEDVRIFRPENCEQSITRRVNDYFDELDVDPIEIAVRNRKKELVIKYNQNQIVSENI